MDFDMESQDDFLGSSRGQDLILMVLDGIKSEYADEFEPSGSEGDVEFAITPPVEVGDETFGAEMKFVIKGKLLELSAQLLDLSGSPKKLASLGRQGFGVGDIRGMRKFVFDVLAKVDVFVKKKEQGRGASSGKVASDMMRMARDLESGRYS